MNVGRSTTSLTSDYPPGFHETVGNRQRRGMQPGHIDTALQKGAVGTELPIAKQGHEQVDGTRLTETGVPSDGRGFPYDSTDGVLGVFRRSSGQTHQSFHIQLAVHEKIRRGTGS